jgi:hypothetical protein
MTVVLSILFYCSKTDNPVSGTQKIEYPQGGSTAAAFIKVLDARSGTPLNNIKISIEGVQSCSTKVNGIAHFNDLHIGDYLLTAFGAEYETVTSRVTIHADSSNSTVPLALQTTVELRMFRKGIVIRGQLYYQKDKTLHPVSQQAVELFISAPEVIFMDPLKTVKALPNGSFYLDSIPEGIQATLRVKNFTTGGVFYTQDMPLQINTGNIGDTITCLPVILQPATRGYFTILRDNTDSIKDTTSLLIVFSLPVDTLKTNLDSIYIYDGSTAQGRILLNKQWNKTTTVLSMKPYNGIWKQGVLYTIVIGRLSSTTGEVLYNINPGRTFSVMPAGIPSDVKNLRVNYPLAIDYSTTSVMLQWSSVTGAGGYEVYSKIQGDSIWKSATNAFSAADTLKSISTYGAFSIGKSMDVFVLGIFSGRRSSPETATILTLRDNVKPKIINSIYVFPIYDCNNVSNLPVMRDFPSMLQFSEPMDTIYKPVISIKETLYSNYGDTSYTLPSDSIKCNWISVTIMQLKAIIPGLTDASYDSVLIDLRNCKDHSGNPVNIPDSLGAPVQPILKFITR